MKIEEIPVTKTVTVMEKRFVLSEIEMRAILLLVGPLCPKTMAATIKKSIFYKRNKDDAVALSAILNKLPHGTYAFMDSK